jgi:hypothetical protein
MITSGAIAKPPSATTKEGIMHALLGVLASVLLVVTLAAADEKATHPPAPHMSECSAQASEKHLTGEERRHFMIDCHKRHTTPHEKGTELDTHSGSTNGEHHTTQGEKMKTCNQDASAKNLHGDERKAFMSQCLKAGKES